MIEVHRTYKYRLYRCDKRDKYLHRRINIAGAIWNHTLALQRRYYRLTGKYITLSVLQSHIANLRMRTNRYAFWKQLVAQSVQEVLERLDLGYQRFFKKIVKRAPKFKNMRQRKSYTLKQSGWKLLSYNQNTVKANGKPSSARGVVNIQGMTYKFVQHRPLKGEIKSLTVKRDAIGRLWLYFKVVEQVAIPEAVPSPKIGGFDFGLKTFLTDHTGKTYQSGLHYRHALVRLGMLQSRLDKKQIGSNNRKKAAKLIARTHIRVADKRRDAHFKLAHELCDEYDLLCFEDLNIVGMKSRWGRKVSDLAFRQFVDILKHVAAKRGKLVIQIGKWERTTGKCSGCEHEQTLKLHERTFKCENCELVLDRDHNAAINIRNAGVQAYTNRETVNRIPKKLRRLARG